MTNCDDWKNVAAVGLWIVVFLSTVHETCGKTAQENLDYMNTLANEQGALIEGSDGIFTKYVKSKHSKYSVVAIFNAVHPKHGCEICQEASGEFIIAAQSYAAIAKNDQNIFFVVLDYDNAPESFMKMNLNHAPEIVFFPRNHKKRKNNNYDISRYGMKADGILRWLHERSGVKVPVKKPIPWVKVSFVAMAVVLLSLVAICKPALCLAVFTSSTLWGIIIMLCVLAMTSGQMWNIIRNASNYGRYRNGETRLVMESESSQYRYESYFISLLNGSVALGFILLNQASEIGHKILRKAVGFVGLVMIMAIFGYLISMFRMKSHGYPYYLLFE